MYKIGIPTGTWELQWPGIIRDGVEGCQGVPSLLCRCKASPHIQISPVYFQAWNWRFNGFSLVRWGPFWDVLAHCKCLDWVYISKYCADNHNAWSKLSRLSYYIHATGKAEGRGKWKPPTFSYLFEETYFGKSGRDTLFSSLCIWVRQGYRLSCKFLEIKMQICASINWSCKERFGDTNVSLR